MTNEVSANVGGVNIMNLRQGSIIAVVGPKGHGKTTLLRLFAKELEPMEGHSSSEKMKLGRPFVECESRIIR